jgi:hypothetical protein
VVQRTITVPIGSGKTINIMSEAEAANAPGDKLNVKGLSEPICGENSLTKVAKDAHDYQLVHDAVNEIDRRLVNENSVTIFCAMGEHRSVTSVILYLMTKKHLDFESAKRVIESAGGHGAAWTQVTASIRNIQNYPNRSDGRQGPPAVNREDNVAPPGPRTSADTAAGTQAGVWNRRGTESKAFWPDIDYPRGS